MKKYYGVNQTILGGGKPATLLFSNPTAQDEYCGKNDYCDKFAQNIDPAKIKEQDIVIFDTAEQAERYMSYFYGGDDVD